MKVQENAFVEIEYNLTLDSGEEVDRSDPDKPLGFIFGSNQIIPGLEKKLVGMEAGKSAKLVVEPEEGYGPRQKELERELPRKNFPEDMEIEIGMVFQAHTPQGPTNLRVLAVKDDVVTVDFNHPLAGERLTFDVKVISVRKATEEEIEAMAASCQPGGGGCSPDCCSSCGDAGEQCGDGEEK